MDNMIYPFTLIMIWDKWDNTQYDDGQPSINTASYNV